MNTIIELTDADAKFVKPLKRKALVVIDMQNDFITGTLGSKEAIEILPNVKKKIDEYVRNGDEVFFTRDTHYENYLNTEEGKNLPVRHCIKNTEGWNIHSSIERKEFMHIDKQSFGYPYWQAIFHKFSEIEIIGVCTDICVISNALIIKALYSETPITVDASCCAGVTPEKHKAALEVMKSCQINVIGE